MIPKFETWSCLTLPLFSGKTINILNLMTDLNCEPDDIWNPLADRSQGMPVRDCLD